MMAIVQGSGTNSADTVALHELCKDCKTFCSRSRILNSQHAWKQDAERLARDIKHEESKDEEVLVNYFSSVEVHAVSKADKRRIRRLLERDARLLGSHRMSSTSWKPKLKTADRIFEDFSSTDGSSDDEAQNEGSLGRGRKLSKSEYDSSQRSSSCGTSTSTSSAASAGTLGSQSDHQVSEHASDSEAPDAKEDSDSSHGSRASSIISTDSSRGSSGSEIDAIDKKPTYLRGSKDLDILADWHNSRTLTFGRLWRSAKRGCHLCNLLLPRRTARPRDALTNEPSREDARKTVHVVCTFSPTVGHAFICSLIPHDNHVRRVLRIRKVAEDRSKESEIARIFDSRMNFNFNEPHNPARDSVNTASAAMTSMIEDWVSKCLEGHPICRQTITDHRELPSRLLDLDISPDETCIVLRETSAGVPVSAEYVALSHCWGGVDINSLKRSSLEAFKKGIAIESLPRTFRDCISICRKLKVRYLWIDSLCIINDDDDDWKREAAAMSTVYSNCLWSLAALHGANSEAGCYKERDPRAYLPCKLPSKFSIYAEPRIKMSRIVADSRTFQGKSIVMKPLGRGTEIDTPLLRRAWVLQEQYLAPRTVYFGARNVFWECRTCEASDICPDAKIENFCTKGVLHDLLQLWKGETRAFAFMWIRKTVKRHKKAKRIRAAGPEYIEGELDEELSRQAGFSVAWSEVVAHFSRLGMTRQRDKLAALQGIVALISQRTGLTPFYGMWKETIFDELLWKRKVGSGGSQTMCAPSFSWASIDGSINRMRDFCHAPSERRCEIKEMADPGGSAEFGHIVMTATLIDLSSALVWAHPPRPGDVTIFELRQGTATERFRRGVLHKFWITMDWKTKDSSARYLMPMAAFNRNNTIRTTHGLVLIRPDPTVDDYIRVGAFETDSPMETESWWDISHNNPHQLSVMEKELRLV